MLYTKPIESLKKIMYGRKVIRQIYEAISKEAYIDGPIGFATWFLENMEAMNIDPMWRRHSQNVGELLNRFIEKYGDCFKIPKERYSAFYAGGLLHDIGKLDFIGQKGDSSVLNGKSDPSDSELKIIGLHPDRGRTYISFINKKRKIGLINGDTDMIVFQHHADYNGRGFPLGLEGEDIHIGARIARVADTMDAVVDPSHPKKKGQKTCDVHEIRSILKNGSGNQFDPAVAEAFCELLGDESIIKKLSAANGNKGPPPTQ